VAGRAYLFRDFAKGAAAMRDCVQSGTPVATLRLSDAEETRFYRAFAKSGQAPAPWDGIVSKALSLSRFERPCLLIAQFEGPTSIVSLGRQGVGRIARHYGALPLGSGPVTNWRQRRFHGPYLRDPMLDRGLGVDTLETATSWSKLHTLYAAVKKALEKAIA